MVVVMVVVRVYDHDNLRLRRIGDCEAEKKHDSKQDLFHNSVSLRANRNREQL
jgi:hypothetical protein